MEKVVRIWVEKKPGFDVEARHMQRDLSENLGMDALEEVRLLARYDVQGLSREEMEAALGTVFSEPNVDTVTTEDFAPGGEWQWFAMEYLPGQYDQRADSAAQCVQMLTGGERPLVQSARVIALKGTLTSEDMTRVHRYLINPVDSRLASPEKPKTLTVVPAPPQPVADVEGFIGMDDEALAEYWRGMGFAMSAADLAFCRDYFKGEGRNPTVTELKVIDTYWSDHCRHTTFLTGLTAIDIADSDRSPAVAAALEAVLAAYRDARTEVYGDRTAQKAETLMDMATMGMRLLKKRGMIPDLDESEEINACSIEVPVTVDGKTEAWLVQFKNETHNHPTEIEPFGGAATCLGGAIRDPLSGRAYVYQAMRVTGASDPRQPYADTMAGKLPAKKITTGAAAGYSSYGNQIGLATGQVAEIYDAGYAAKRMEIGAVVGGSPKANVVRMRPEPGDVVVLLGGATGRDGCGGATGSSKAHTEASITDCSAEVQKGNPPTERKIQRLFRNPNVSRMIKRCNDFGAGGVCVAIGELASGLYIRLDAVPKKYEGLDGTELAISESQERMAVVLAAGDTEAFIAAAAEENLEAVPVAEVTEQPRLVMEWQGARIVDIGRDFLDTNGVTQTASALIQTPNPSQDPRRVIPKSLEEMPAAQAFAAKLSRLEVASQKGLVERFDASIGAATVNMPFGGLYQLSPEEGMAAKLPVNGETDDATAMTFGFMPALSRWSPFHGAAFAVVQSLARLAAMGADPSAARLTFQEYFERLHDEPLRWGKPVAALLGALQAQLHMGVPSIGGKDSMSGSFQDLDVPPTLVSFALAMTKASHTGTAAFGKSGSPVVLLTLPVDDTTRLPDWPRAKTMLQEVSRMVREGAIVSASVVGEGGAGACVARMCFGNRIGFVFDGIPDGGTLFAPQCGSLVVELREDMLPHNLPCRLLGYTRGNPSICLDGAELPLDELISCWQEPLEAVFPQQAPDAAWYPVAWDTAPVARRAPVIKTAKPRVFIPVFPGTNCEYDTARAFEKAGAVPEVMVVKNRTAADFHETIQRMEQGIRNAQIVMLPGGFSGGDEPDGSGKFIATTLRNPRLAGAIAELLEKRDGLMLGICNGFQALIKLGLVPYGEIRPIAPDDPTLTFNSIGRHISRMVCTEVVSVRSPWLAGCRPGDVYTIPVSHGEGRFYAGEAAVRALADSGQIATRYVTPDGRAIPGISANVNGSVCAVEGITSPDGRVFGKMAHNERSGKDVCRNVPGNKDQKLFESGVGYFR